MPSEALPAYILMIVTDSAHARYPKEGRLVRVEYDAQDEHVTEFDLLFSDGEQVTFAPAQVRLIREG
jgi:hypothetical protein